MITTFQLGQVFNVNIPLPWLLACCVDLLLASLDAARWSLTGKQGKGKSRLHAAVQLVRSVKKEIGDIEGTYGASVALQLATERKGFSVFGLHLVLYYVDVLIQR